MVYEWVVYGAWRMCAVLYCTILHYTVLHYTILYYTILDYAILLYLIEVQHEIIPAHPKHAVISLYESKGALVDGIQVEKVTTTSQNKSGIVWIYDTVYTGYTWSPLTLVHSVGVHDTLMLLYSA
jgi:hypothetical protein